MKIALYGKKIGESFYPYLEQLLAGLSARNATLYWFAPFYAFLRGSGCRLPEAAGYFDSASPLPADTDLLLSIGGDGTLLDAVVCIGDSGIPALGINSGRLGFLANVAQEEIPEALDKLFAGRYTLLKRALLSLDTDDHLFSGFRYALNEISVQKTDKSSLINIHAWVNGEYLTTYWADGLIVATPTGSTAYSLSGGGPILSPDCDNLILTPVCPHNLNMRPLVLPGRGEVRLRVESRSHEYILSLDSRLHTLSESRELIITQASFGVNVVRLEGYGYFRTLRDKSGWGLDNRNAPERSPLTRTTQ